MLGPFPFVHTVTKILLAEHFTINMLITGTEEQCVWEIIQFFKG